MAYRWHVVRRTVGTGYAVTWLYHDVEHRANLAPTSSKKTCGPAGTEVGGAPLARGTPWCGPEGGESLEIPKNSFLKVELFQTVSS